MGDLLRRVSFFYISFCAPIFFGQDVNVRSLKTNFRDSCYLDT